MTMYAEIWKLDEILSSMVDATRAAMGARKATELTLFFVSRVKITAWLMIN